MLFKDTVIWMGDFNYRIGLSHERAMELVKKLDLEKLYENDQVSVRILKLSWSSTAYVNYTVESANGSWPFFPILLRS